MRRSDAAKHPQWAKQNTKLHHLMDITHFLFSVTVLCCYAAIISAHYGTIPLPAIPGRRGPVPALRLKVSLVIEGVLFQPFGGCLFSATVVVDCEAL